MGNLYTVGHSNRDVEEFVAMLLSVGVSRVVDVRKLRGSARYPQFDADALASSLGASGIDLVASPALAGRRPVSRDVGFDVNGWWTNRSFHNYADHALSAEFAEALQVLCDQAAAATVAIMCSEAVWWRCHRRIIADHLLARDVPVLHLMAASRAEPARLSEGAVVGRDGTLTYPAAR